MTIDKSANTANSKSVSASGKGPSLTEQEALDFHSRGRPGKLEITPTKPMATQRDLSLAYSPGVAVPVLAIAADPALVVVHWQVVPNIVVVRNVAAVAGIPKCHQ